MWQLNYTRWKRREASEQILARRPHICGTRPQKELPDCSRQVIFRTSLSLLANGDALIIRKTFRREAKTGVGKRQAHHVARHGAAKQSSLFVSSLYQRLSYIECSSTSPGSDVFSMELSI